MSSWTPLHPLTRRWRCAQPVTRRLHRRAPPGRAAGADRQLRRFHADTAALAAQGERPLLAVATGWRFTQGFFDQTAELWSHDGHLQASSHQVVYYKN